MDITYKDDIFGEMTYKHRWYKQQALMMFGKDWDVTVAAKAYSGKEITEDQRKSYSNFCDNESAMIELIEVKLKEYINENLQDLAVYWIGARAVNTVNELVHMVTPKTLLFKQDGTTIMLLDCIWDQEHGIAVQILPTIRVGTQELFL